MEVKYVLMISVVFSILLLTGCNQWDKTIACHRDQDCPTDAGVPFCTQWVKDVDPDSGLNAQETLELEQGYCTADKEYKGNFLPTDSGSVAEATGKDDEMNMAPGMGGGPSGGGGPGGG